MKKKGLIFLVCFIVVCVNTVSAQMSKSQLQQMYLSHLREQGYLPSIDSDGDIQFKSEGDTFYILVQEDDLESFIILYPNFWSIDSTEERIRALEAASRANIISKVTRVYLTSRANTSIEAGIFLLKPEDFKSFFARMLRAITASKRTFIDEMQK